MKLFILLSVVILVSCSNGRNELMTKLMYEKRQLQDSNEYSRFYEAEYTKKAKMAMRDPDSTKWQKLSDSSTQFYMIGVRARKRITQIDFSIDSLSKMK